MPRYRIVFMGSPDFAIPALQTLAKSHDICAVYTQPAKPAGPSVRVMRGKQTDAVGIGKNGAAIPSTAGTR